MIELPAIRGIQQYRQFYTLMLTLRQAAWSCVSKDAVSEKEWGGEVPLEYRRQRRLSAIRANKLFQYLMHAGLTKTDYVLPSLTVTIDGHIKFIGTGSAGVIHVEQDKPWFLADGQHRVEAIKRVIAVFHRGEYQRRKLTATEKYNLEWLVDSHIPVTVFHECGDKLAQQIFSDINRNSSKPDRELLAALDHRSKTQP